jgi:hypothetical protein
MSEESVVGIYGTMSGAEQAVRELGRAGVPLHRISIVAQNLESEKEIHGYVNAGDIAKGGAGTGAWVGGLFGVLMGVAFLWVPGFGPLLVAGPLSAALLGGVEGAAIGAAGGGLLGGLIGWGVSRKHILKYEEHLRGGKYLLLVHGSHEEVQRAHDVLQGTGATQLDLHREPAAV